MVYHDNFNIKNGLVLQETFQKRKVNSQSADAQVGLEFEMRNWVDTVGEKKKDRIYGLGPQACDVVRGESSSRISLDSQLPWQQEFESRIASLNAKWHAYFNQLNVMFNSIFDYLQIKPPFPFPTPPFPSYCPTGSTQQTHQYTTQGPTNEDVQHGDDQQQNEVDDALLGKDH